MTWFALVESNTTGSGRQFCAAARDLGLSPVVLCARPERYPYLAEDEVEHRVVDTADPAAVLAAARQLAGAPGLAGVTSSSEYFIATAARVAVELGLSAPDPEAVERCRHKDRQRAVLAAAGVAGPAHHTASGVGEAVAAADKLGYPVVVKPTTGSGSVGVRLCVGPEEVAAHAGPLLEAPVDERGRPVPGLVLIEEYVAGPEFSVETFDGEVVAVVAKHLGPEPHFVETGHDYPAPVPDRVTAGLAATAVAALRALGLGWGAAHVELRHPATGPVLIEVNPRLAGGMIPTLVRVAAGVDLVAATVTRAAGLPVQPPLPARDGSPGPVHAAIRFALTDRPGTVTAVHGVAEALARPGVTGCEITVAAGAEVGVTHSFRDRFGYAVATGPDHGTAAGRAARAAATLRLETR